MTHRFLTASTAIGAALLLTSPTVAQPLPDPTLRPVCADGAAPVCADGSTVLSLGEMMERGTLGSDLRAALGQLLGQTREAAICVDGEAATCAPDVDIVLPGTPEYEAVLNGTMAPDAQAEAEAPAQADAQAIADAESRLRAELADTAEAESRARTEAEAEAEEAAQAELRRQADDAVDDARSEAEAAARIAQEEAAARAAEAEAVADAATSETSANAAEAEAEVAAEAEASAETVHNLEQALEQSAAGTRPRAGGRVEAEARSEARAEADADPRLADDTARLVEQLTGRGRGVDGDTAGSLLAALARGGRDDASAEAAETVETEVTEEDTRQSDEDFSTDPAGRQSATSEAATTAQPRRNRDLERLALLGLGALAVGAILSNGDEVVSNTGDRVVVRRGGDAQDFYVLRDDDVTLRQPGSRVRTERFDDGSSRTFVTRDDGSIIITVRDASGRVVLREREDTQGRRVILIDDTVTYEPVVISTLPPPSRRQVMVIDSDATAIRAALDRETARNIDRSFSLRQVREVEQVRKLVPEIAAEPITFETASAAIRPTEAQSLAELGVLMVRLIETDPREVFLIEGHTDAVGGAAYNLALSDRRAESVALALTEYFGVPPENMVVQGYGLSDLLIPTSSAEVRNRRVTVRRITPLLTDRLARN
jgi:outer membrane protein OmpA-like peptidoglycan-associated protein